MPVALPGAGELTFLLDRSSESCGKLSFSWAGPITAQQVCGARQRGGSHPAIKVIEVGTVDSGLKV